MPRVSIIIPAYNSEESVERAIDSVLEQTYDGEMEILVIDDDSDDNTRAVVSSIAARNRQVVLMKNQRAKGPSGARNTGLLAARGEFIAFLDSDDLWLGNHLEEGMGFLETHDEIDVVFFNFEKYDRDSGRRISDWFSERKFLQTLRVKKLDDGFYMVCDDLFSALLDESFMHLQSMIVRDSTRNGVLFNERVHRSEDRDFAMRLWTESGARVAYKNVITGIYYRHQDSLTADSLNNSVLSLQDQILLLEQYLADQELDYGLAPRLVKLLRQKYLALSYCYRRLGLLGLAVRAVLDSRRYGNSPRQVEQLAKIVITRMSRGFPRRGGPSA
jgi:glycosyltransferase involved in cell wall biosynthesis